MTLEVEKCSVALGGVTVLSEVSAAVGPGAWLGVIGPNGAGKSTMARAVVGLVAFAGRISVKGRELSSCDKRQWARLVAYVPQRPVLPLSMTVTDYVLLGRTAHHSYLAAETTRDRRVTAAVLERLELGKFAHRRIGQLSGGESQRAVLARALVQEAPLLVLDEPTTSLDLGHSQLVLELTDELRREKGISVFCTIHDLTLAGQYSDHLLVLSQGRSVQAGTPAQVLTQANVERFFGADVEVMAGRCGPAAVPVRKPARLAAANRPAGGPVRASLSK
jgi:iron complex transport system ATP-binding protein